jgi:hypothetical protein
MRPCHPLLGYQLLERVHYLDGCAFSKPRSLSLMGLQLRRPPPFQNGFFFLIQGGCGPKKRRRHCFDHDHENGLEVRLVNGLHRGVDETCMISVYGHTTVAANQIPLDHHQPRYLSQSQASLNVTVLCDRSGQWYHGGIPVPRVHMICKMDNPPALVFVWVGGQMGVSVGGENE